MADAQDTRSVSQLKSDIAAARARMNANVEGLVKEVHPQAVKERAIDDAKAFAMAEVNSLKSQVKDEVGWRTDRLTVAGVVVAGTVAALLVLRCIVQRIRS